jgi:ADP-L-glycero-D-manno-heptose 6-epimerase
MITGAAGFIASCMASFLNRQGYKRLILVDDFSNEDKKKNYTHIIYSELLDRASLSDYLEKKPALNYVIHFGARTDTTEMDPEVHHQLNLLPSILLWNYCATNNIPLIYASSAATYGNGEHGYSDDHVLIPQLKPLNPYGESKQQFDLYVLEKVAAGITPPHWYGLKFFNVYGPNEYHKGRMASVIFHAFHQIRSTGQMRLFRSHHADYKDGEQRRDFIYVLDVLEVCWWIIQDQPVSSIYNLGTGNSSTFLQLAEAVFKSMELEPKINFIDTPIDIRDKYQYFTEANMQKLIDAGFPGLFSNIEYGVDDYVRNYLIPQTYYGVHMDSK